MLEVLFIICFCILKVEALEVCDERYCLMSNGSQSRFEEASLKCENSWIIEIYNDNIMTLLTKLNTNNALRIGSTLLGIQRSKSSAWMWSDQTPFLGNVENKYGGTNYGACITNENSQIKYIAKSLFEFRGIICSKVVQKDSCTGWFHEGICYFKPNPANCTWYQAHNECIKYQATLAIFRNNETNFNTSFIDNQTYWVSLSTSTWKWDHSGDVVTFNKWTNNYPFFEPYNQYCVFANSDGNDWISARCHEMLDIVCMKESNGDPRRSPNPSISPTTIDDIRTNGFQNTNSGEARRAEDQGPLSSGAKAGIGVGVSLLVVLILLIGVLVFKYFHQLKSKSKDDVEPHVVYEKPAVNSPNKTEKSIYQGLVNN